MVLRSVKSMQGYKIKTHTEDNVGAIHDFYFDDHNWNICYLVVDTGDFLAGRKVLVSPEAFDRLNWADEIVTVNLTPEQIKNSPDLDLGQPITCGQEDNLRDYYGWEPVNRPGSGLLIGHSVLTPRDVLEDSVRAATVEGGEAAENKPHLRSANEVLGYYLQARDDDAGHLEDFLVDDRNWMIQYAVVDTRNWLPGKRVLVSPSWIEKISGNASRIYINLSQETIKNSPEYDPATPPDEEFDEKVYDHSDQARYWLRR